MATFFLLSLVSLVPTAALNCQATCINGTMQCWMDDWGNPILQYWAYGVSSATMTLETCMAACFSHSVDHTIFGIENGADPNNAECWCGSYPRWPAVPNSTDA